MCHEKSVCKGNTIFVESEKEKNEISHKILCGITYSLKNVNKK